jgi:hypothetical protein
MLAVRKHSRSVLDISSLFPSGTTIGISMVVVGTHNLPLRSSRRYVGELVGSSVGGRVDGLVGTGAGPALGPH